MEEWKRQAYEIWKDIITKTFYAKHTISAREYKQRISGNYILDIDQTLSDKYWSLFTKYKNADNWQVAINVANDIVTELAKEPEE